MFSILLTFNTLKILTFAFLCKYFFKIINRTQVNNLEKRVSEHKNKRYKTSFSARYNVDKLVYYEEFQWIQEALKREKVLKKWKREWKIELVVNNNPNWYDLSLEW